MRITEELYLVGSGQYGLSHPFDCSVYLVDCGTELALIDAGAGVIIDPIVENVRREGLDPTHLRTVIVTHAHADHSGGAQAFREQYGCEIYAPQGDIRLIEAGTDEEMGLHIATRSGFYTSDYVYPHSKVDKGVSDGDQITVGRVTFSAIQVPGHSEHSICLLWEKGDTKILFSADVVFFEGRIGLLNYPGSSLAAYRRNIQKLSDLAVDMLFPGHGIFVLKDGQRHIDLAIDALSRLQIPSNFI
ncbi:MAG: MBL fold metallo-hydrolase [Candidatus Bipolaricaulia bacterium]